MDGVFRTDGSFTIWNGQFNEAGQQLGGTDWWLNSGKAIPPAAVPEPFSLILLGSGVPSLFARRKSS